MFFSLFFLLSLISQNYYKLRTHSSFYLTFKLSFQSLFIVCFLTSVCFLHPLISIVFIVSILLTISVFLTYFLVDSLIIHFYRCIGWKLNNRLNDHQFSGSKYWKMSSLNLLLDHNNILYEDPSQGEGPSKPIQFPFIDLVENYYDDFIESSPRSFY
jgi:hypothetical protein